MQLDLDEKAYLKNAIICANIIEDWGIIHDCVKLGTPTLLTVSGLCWV